MIGEEMPLDEAAVQATEEAERRTSYLELFFDLVFVFAITQVTTLILADTSAEGFARSALILGMIWWAWSAYAWMTNAIELSEPLVRVAFLLGMGGSFLVALGVPGAYGDEDLWFALPYFGVRLVQVLLYLYGLRLDPAHQAAMKKLAPYFLISPVVVVIGGLFDDPFRTWFWLVALAIDVGGTLTVAGAGFRVSPSHFAERYGLFIIIALGESIVAIGVGAAAVERDAGFAAAVAISFVGVAGLWWAYFDFVAGAVDRALHRAPIASRAPLARDLFTLFHYPIVLGIVLFAVAAKKTVEHAGDPLGAAGRFALGAGVAIFMTGFVLGRYRVLRRIAWERIGAGAAAGLAVVVLSDLAAAGLMVVVIAILALALAVEAVRLRELRTSAPSS
jgi:low temperature requirement protein LtrA